MDGIWGDCLVPSNQQKVYQGASVLASCGSLPLWNYPGIAPDLSWAGEEWLVGREKRPKGQYGSVKLEISNWRKISGGGEVGAALHRWFLLLQVWTFMAQIFTALIGLNGRCNAAPTSPPPLSPAVRTVCWPWMPKFSSSYLFPASLNHTDLSWREKTNLSYAIHEKCCPFHIP